MIFCDALGDFFWHRELNVPVRNEVRWSETLYLRPLLEALDEYERYGVILADRAQARLFTVYLGEIEEHGESFAPGEVKIVKAPGRDHIRSDMRFQRKADQYAQRHLKRVAELAVELAERHAFDRLMLAGPVEATLRAMRQGRIWRLVYADGFAPSGSRCANCAMLFEERLESCAYCDAAVWPVDDLVEQAAQRVVMSGGKVEQVRGAMANRLTVADGKIRTSPLDQIIFSLVPSPPFRLDMTVWALRRRPDAGRPRRSGRLNVASLQRKYFSQLNQVSSNQNRDENRVDTEGPMRGYCNVEPN